MRKIVSKVLLVLFFIMVPSFVKAASVNVTLKCPGSAAVNQTISCTIGINSGVKVNGVLGNFEFSGATYVGFTPTNGFTANGPISKNGFSIGNTSGKSGSYTLGTLKVKVTSAATITIKNLDVSDVNFAAYSPSNKVATVRIASSNDKLNSLTLSNGTLSPSFSSTVTSYTAKIDASSVTISATKGDSYQTISGTGKKNLVYGSNIFNIVVTSEAGTKRTYKIVITRPDNRSDNNYLKTLSLDIGKISFKKETTSYSLKVGKDVSSMNISATLEDTKASFVKGYGPRTVKLNLGKNKILVNVRAENGEVKTYTINVEREDSRSSNSYLSSIILSEGAISFSKDKFDYSMSVPYSVSKIVVTAQAEDSKSKVVVNSPNLVVGNNVVTITVTAENGDKKVYIINVRRLSEAEDLSDNNNVSSIDILGHGIEFDKDVTEYDISIGDEYALVFDILLEDPSAKYVVEGNEDLKDGSVITVTSTSESGEVRQYKFNISKKIKAVNVNKSSGGLIYGFIGFIIGLVTMFITMLLVGKIKYRKQLALAGGQVSEPKVVAPKVVSEKAIETPNVEVTSTVTKVDAAPATASEPVVSSAAVSPSTSSASVEQVSALTPSGTTTTVQSTDKK